MQDICWIIGEPELHLAIVMRPRGEEWLDDELIRLQRNGIDTLVSLLEPAESQALGLGREDEAARSAGVTFLSFPIPDRNVPQDANRFRAFAEELGERLRAGERIGIHCRGCIGRATITAACTLRHLGWEAKTALTAIARARGVPVPDTLEQEHWILEYEP